MTTQIGNLKPNRDYDPALDGTDEDFDNEYKAALLEPERPPLPTEEFNRIADELQVAVDLAQSRMRICAEPEYGELAAALKLAKSAMHEHYKLKGDDAVFAEGATRDAYLLKELASRAKRVQEAAAERQRIARERKRESNRQYRN